MNMPQLEHPQVTEINRKGFLNTCAQPEHMGNDFFGDEILVGDSVVEYDGEIILKDNLERFLSEEMDFVFKTAD
jgi:hypothetical protein